MANVTDTKINQKRKDEDDNLNDILIAAATSQHTVGKSDYSDNPLMELALLELADRRARKEEEKADLLRFHAARAEAHKDSEARRLAGQAACTHIKERGYGSRIGGQKLSNNHICYICQLCGKTWDETNLPAHLQVPMEFIGG